MPLINENFQTDIKGIQLWHAPMSSCSQRVRMVLNFHDIRFTSNIVKLNKGEHASKKFLEINPKGLVPVLSDEKKIINESNDIIQYVDNKFGSSKLSKNIDKKKIVSFLKEIDDTQKSLKLCTFHFLFRSQERMPDKEYNFFKSNHKNKDLVNFYSNYEGGFKKNEIVNAININRKFFNNIEKIMLKNSSSVFPNGLSLADISLIPNVHRFNLMGWPFEKYPNIFSWYKNINKSNWFKKGILDWEPPELISNFNNYVKNSTKISSFL